MVSKQSATYPSAAAITQAVLALAPAPAADCTAAAPRRKAKNTEQRGVAHRLEHIEESNSVCRIAKEAVPLSYLLTREATTCTSYQGGQAQVNQIHAIARFLHADAKVPNNQAYRTYVL